MTSFFVNIAPDVKTGENYGKPWSDADIATLEAGFLEGISVYELCKQLGRTTYGVLSQLREQGLLGYSSQTRSYVLTYRALRRRQHAQRTADLTKPQEKPEMSTNIEITTKHFIGGIDAASLSDADIFGLIAKKEAEIEKLEQIKSKPQKLKKQIDKAREEIAKLVEFVDGR